MTSALRALAAAAALACGASASSLHPVTPEFPHDASWINASGLSMRRMSGRKAVLVAFLNPSSVNSLRTLPVLNALFDRYALSQLMVVAVMTPDLDFQRDANWAKRAVERLGIEFPVVLDPDRRLWKAYGAEGWPAIYLSDPSGRVIFDQLGEGGWKELERQIRLSVGELAEEGTLPAPLDQPEPKTRDCGTATADLPLGARKGSRTPMKIDKVEENASGNRVIVAARDGELASLGRWEPQADGLRLAQGNKRLNVWLRVVYGALQTTAVLSPPESGSARLYVKQDDLWLHPGNAGSSIQYDDDGRSFVLVKEPRLYELTRDPTVAPRELFLIPDRQGVVVHVISFADSCRLSPIP